jgi:hypothetical protein
VYGPSFGNKDEFGASAEPGEGNDDKVAKLVGIGGGAEGILAKFVDEEEKEGFETVVSSEGWWA